MTYKRVVARNQLHGNYEGNPTVYTVAPSFIAGDLRRLESDQRDDRHLAEYARRAGVSVRQAKAVLDAFFEGDF